VKRSISIDALLAFAGIAFLSIPLLGLLMRVPWSALPALWNNSDLHEAIRLSAICSISASLLAAGFGLPIAHWLARGDNFARRAVRVLVVLPMVLPPVVAGVALLLAFGRHGLIGAPLEAWFGIRLSFSTWAVVLAEAYIALPFFVLTVEAGFRSLDTRQLQAAASLGASPSYRFRTMSLPLIRPALAAGLLLAWARALGEFGASMTFAGNLAGETRTLPLAVYTALESQPDAAIAWSLILVLISASVLFLLRDRWFRFSTESKPSSHNEVSS